MNVNDTIKRQVPAELIPLVVRTYGDILLRNPHADETVTWNIAAQLVWLAELADTQLFVQRLLNSK